MTEPASPTLQTPQAMIDAARTRYMANEIGQADYMAVVDRYGPQLSQNVVTAPTPVQARSAAADTLRQQRVDGKISQADYFAAMEKNATGAPTDGTPIVTEAAAEDADFAPPETPDHYRFTAEPSDGEGDPEWARTVRTTFYELGMPQRFAAPIYDAVSKLAARFADTSPEEKLAHCEQVTRTMRQAWGDDFDAKLARIDSEIFLKMKGPLGELFDKEPVLAADPAIWSFLDRHLEHKFKRTA